MNVRYCALVAAAAVLLAAGMTEAEEAGGFWVKHAGQMSDVMMRKDYSAHMDISTLKGVPHLYAMGPVEGLNGEVTVLDSEPSIATVEAGKVSTAKRYPRAAFLVYGQAANWQQVAIPATIKTDRELEGFVAKAARSKGVDVDKPFPFLVKGTPAEIGFHVVKAGEHVTFTIKAKAVQILGFYSSHDQGVFVHHGTNIHLHFVT